MKRPAPAENHTEKRRAPAKNHAEPAQMHMGSLQHMHKCRCCGDGIERVTTSDICDSCQYPLCPQCLREADHQQLDCRLCCQGCIELMQHNAMVLAEEEIADAHSTVNYAFSLACCESCDDDGDSGHDVDSDIEEIGSANIVHQVFVFAIAPVTRR